MSPNTTTCDPVKPFDTLNYEYKITFLSCMCVIMVIYILTIIFMILSSCLSSFTHQICNFIWGYYFIRIYLLVTISAKIEISTFSSSFWFRDLFVPHLVHLLCWIEMWYKTISIFENLVNFFDQSSAARTPR